ncbi:hypothetical protein [Microbacterium sp. A1-JK]|uniref:hypothetical protein n=1 Tax=Microbacterium sp. A1-JK TaxID=3177516 RepID=UPI003887F853
MARTDLTAMLGKLDEPPAAAPTAATKDAAMPAAQPAKRASRPSAPRRDPAPMPSAGGYRSYERKEARLRPDQYARLTEESRRLNRAKETGGERITENTLIRVAIDLLLERSDRLAGATEEEIRHSVTP